MPDNVYRICIIKEFMIEVTSDTEQHAEEFAKQHEENWKQVNVEAIVDSKKPVK